MKFSSWLGAFALVPAISVPASAAVPAFECRACTPAQEQGMALAKPGQGLRFVYDFASHSIRKFDVVYHTGGGNKAIREALEMPVDADVQRLFALYDALHTRSPVLVEQGQIRVDVASLGVTEGSSGVRFFDLARVAWHASTGQEYQRFMGRLSAMLASPPDTRMLSGELADLLHGINLGFKSTYVEGGTGGATVGVSLEKGATITMEVCDGDGICSVVHINTTADNALTYEKTIDTRSDNVLPSQQMSFPHAWNFYDRNDAREFGERIARSTGGHFSMGILSCTEVVLTCARQGSTTFIGCRVDCM
ncbi:hypothetical protein [Tahibacter amnicola]|uniref:Uncharacterized protein n=1 Tax=Tahibacter amnicola TaxID=2976241 RepID=A0ABY6BD91_9GAMM|nr:hypothetical protein [Tahibacter amnicola]UXI67772.1 hypothetical protein N4264_24065 [Tahibacter amnicola]